VSKQKKQDFGTSRRRLSNKATRTFPARKGRLGGLWSERAPNLFCGDVVRTRPVCGLSECPGQVGNQGRTRFAHAELSRFRPRLYDETLIGPDGSPNAISRAQRVMGVCEPEFGLLASRYKITDGFGAGNLITVQIVSAVRRAPSPRKCFGWRKGEPRRRPQEGRGCVCFCLMERPRWWIRSRGAASRNP